MIDVRADQRAPERPFAELAGSCAYAAAAGAVAFAVLFVYIVAGAPRWVGGLWMLCLIVGELLTVVVLVGLCRLLRAVDGGAATTALALGLMGAMGGIAHGAQVLELVVKAPAGLEGEPTVELDPRGIFRYAVAGLAMVVLGWLMAASPGVPRRLVGLSIVGGALLVLIYVGRLTEVIDPAHRLTLTPPVLYGLVVGPLWFLDAGRLLKRAETVRG